MSVTSSIAVLCNKSNLNKRLLLGIASYANKYNDLLISPIEINESIVDYINGYHFSAAIVIDNVYDHKAIVRQISESVPSVLIGNSDQSIDLPVFDLDYNTIASFAAKSLIARGFRQLAFVGIMGMSSSQLIQSAFDSILRTKGVNPFVFTCHPSIRVRNQQSGDLEATKRRLAHWLKSLPKNTGILAADDGLAFEVVEQASKIGISVPQDLAVIGVGDDELLCKISNPYLSSIRLPYEKIGYDAAMSVHALLKNKDTSKFKGNNIYQPTVVISRASTNTIIAADEIVKKTLLYMAENYMKSINVESILEYLGVSRSLLERKFRDELGVTPLVELRRVRIEKAMELLADTDMSINELGEQCGFSSAIRFTTVFKEQVGVTPSIFRKQVQPNFA